MAGSRRIGTTTHPHTHLFTQVDRSGDPDFFVRFMDETQKLAAIQTSRKLMLERIALAPGQSVLDVGCGPEPICSTWWSSSVRPAVLLGSTRVKS